MTLGVQKIFYIYFLVWKYVDLLNSQIVYWNFLIFKLVKKNLTDQRTFAPKRPSLVKCRIVVSKLESRSICKRAQDITQSHAWLHRFLYDLLHLLHWQSCYISTPDRRTNMCTLESKIGPKNSNTLQKVFSVIENRRGHWNIFSYCTYFNYILKVSKIWLKRRRQ